MNSFTVHASTLKGSVAIPSSKSHSQRALLFALKAQGNSRLRNLLPSPDIYAMRRAIEQLGARCYDRGDDLEVVPGPPHITSPIHAQNSGQVLRFLSAMAALQPSYVEMTADHLTRKRRPIRPLLRALRQLGGIAESACGDGYPPLIIRGPIHPGICRLSGEDSQPVSALLMATAFVDGTSEIFVDNPGETPWIDVTLDWLRRLGASVTHTGYRHYQIVGGLSYGGLSYTVPGDFSSAAFPLAAALITRSPLVLTGLSQTDVQGDRCFLDIVEQMGASITWEGDQLVIDPGKLEGIEVDVSRCIDALPILAVLGCYAEGETRLHNGAIARLKESDRIAAITCELNKMGADIDELDDGLIVRKSPLRGANVTSHRDHRIALALAVAAMGAKGATRVQESHWIVKSYPTFVEDMQAIGATIELDFVRI